ncbi:hypothetical protein EON81_25725 [bacterium]|nr:MAG: hypothetical protein EON81_25725 [bacterium]
MSRWRRQTENVEPHLQKRYLERWIRRLLIGFIVGLVLSGVTAFPLPGEVTLLVRWSGAESAGTPGPMLAWLLRVHEALNVVDARYPLLAYGTDWLAFAHLVIAAAFVGPLRDPVRNVWVIEWGMIACAGVIPLALIAGPIRGIPFFWRLIDCSFGIVGIVPLFVCWRMIRRLEQFTTLAQTGRG